jgi:phosphoribosylanthranilate isomerase
VVAVKVCGFTSAHDVELALKLGVDAIGVMLDPCPRQVSRHGARELLAATRGESVVRVAVAGKTDLSGVDEALSLGFDLVQAVLSDDDLERADPALPILPVVFDRPDAASRIDTVLDRYASSSPHPLGRINLDGRHGGSGVSADWDLAARTSERAPVMLSGGLTAENVSEAIRRVRPASVDVTSATERALGTKDEARIRSFLAAVRGPAQQRLPPTRRPA